MLLLLIGFLWMHQMLPIAPATESFAPYKKVSAYGKLVYLELAVNKEEDGVKSYAGEDLIENPNEEENA